MQLVSSPVDIFLVMSDRFSDTLLRQYSYSIFNTLSWHLPTILHKNSNFSMSLASNPLGSNLFINYKTPLGRLVNESEPTSYLSVEQNTGIERIYFAFFTNNRINFTLYVSYSKCP